MTDPKGDVAVTSVSLDRQSLEMVEGDDVTLVATVLPENAGNRTVTWKSSDTKVAYVSSGGKVTANKEGSTIITVTTIDGGKTATCNVTVTPGDFTSTGLTKEEAEQAMEKVISDWKADKMEEMKMNFDRKYVTTSSKDVSMNFLCDVYGEEPEDGHSLWISLHGGGGTTADVNDGQWKNQQVMYRQAFPPQPQEGYYISPRAIANTWDMWFLKENTELFEQIIMTMVVSANVNPDKVYLMGYSAGGDGVWRMAPRMADHWAAAAMMAGHPGGVSLLNVRNMPFTLWVGAMDSAYDRNIEVPKKAEELEEMHQNDLSGYIYECHVLAGMPHWMGLKDSAAFDWMAKYKRNTCPSKVVWQYDGGGNQHFYWLGVDKEEAASGKIVTASIRGNSIEIEKSDYKSLTIYLNDRLVDLDKPVKVVYGGREIFKGMVERNEETLRSTMAERDDPGYVFCSKLTVHLNV